MWLDVPAPSPERARLSWSYTALQSVCPQLASADIGSTRPSCPLPRWGGLQGFHLPRVPATSKCSPPASSHGLARSFRVHRASSGRPATVPSPVRSDSSAPPVRFAPLQRLPARSSSIVAGLASPVRLRPQVFSTSRRVSIRREPAGLVSCRIRSWGSTLQSLAPTAWPYAVSDADPLMVLVLLATISPPRPAGTEAPLGSLGRRSTSGLLQRKKRLWKRRPARAAGTRRSVRLGHRSALRSPEGSLHPDRSPACLRPEGRSRFRRFRSPCRGRARPKPCPPFSAPDSKPDIL